MLFIKNILKKKNVKGYVFSMFVITLGLMLFNLMYIKIDNTYNDLKNQEIYRTVIINEKININKLDYIESIVYDDDTTIVVVKDYDDIQKIINYLGDNIDYEINVPNNENIVLFYSIKILIYVMYISFAVILIIYIIQFINDDIKTIQVLRRVGYNKYNIIYRYLSSFILLYTVIFIFACIIINIINIVINKNNYINLIGLSNLKVYIIYICIIALLVYIKIASLSKNKI